MADILKTITCLVWAGLAFLVGVKLRKWNTNFSELYEELREWIEEEQDG